MYNVTIKELGSRLKQIRNYLGLSQKELAEKLNCKQVKISRLENGVSGTITFLASILSFYSQYIYINYLFAEEFFLVSTDNKDVSRSNLDSIVSSIVKDAINEYEKDTCQTTDKLKKSLDKAVRLLNG